MTKELFISDLDGTLLDKSSQLSEKSEILLKTMLKAGLIFTVASLRSIETINIIFKNIPLKLPIIELNGAFITDFNTGRKLAVNSINSNINLPVYHTILSQGLAPAIMSYDGTNSFLNFGTEMNQGLEWYWKNRKQAKDQRLRKLDNFKSIENDAWICITVIADWEQCTECQHQLVSDYGDSINVNILESFDTPGLAWMSITAKSASKYAAIETLKRKFNFKHHKIICFGDQPVDIPMFQAADFSVAVANATNEVKSKSDLVIGSHDSDAVIEWIYQRFTNQSI